MIYTELTKKALKLCFEAHKNQTDKSGLPYVFHPFHLAEQMNDESTTIVALLHDVIEDTEFTIEQIKSLGFSNEILSALKLLTHNDGISYIEYVKTIKTNDIARKVKLADLTHNSDLSRLDIINQEDINRAEKYKIAIDILSE